MQKRVPAYKEAIRLDPKYAPAHYELGMHYFNQMDYPEAIACQGCRSRKQSQNAGGTRPVGRIA